MGRELLEDKVAATCTHLSHGTLENDTFVTVLREGIF